MSEKTTHKAVCDYLRYAYPKVLFNSDLSGSMKLTIGQAKAFKSLRSGKGFPDLFVMEPRGVYHGLFLELKKEGEDLFCKRKCDAAGMPEFINDHVRDQSDVIQSLLKRGYKACFAVGFDEARKIIDNYLKQ